MENPQEAVDERGALRQAAIGKRDDLRRGGIPAVALETYSHRTNRTAHLVLDGPDQAANYRRFMRQCGVSVTEIEGVELRRRKEKKRFIGWLLGTAWLYVYGIFIVGPLFPWALGLDLIREGGILALLVAIGVTGISACGWIASIMIWLRIVEYFEDRKRDRL